MLAPRLFWRCEVWLWPVLGIGGNVSCNVKIIGVGVAVRERREESESWNS